MLQKLLYRKNPNKMDLWKVKPKVLKPSVMVKKSREGPMEVGMSTAIQSPSVFLHMYLSRVVGVQQTGRYFAFHTDESTVVYVRQGDRVKKQKLALSLCQ